LKPSKKGNQHIGFYYEVTDEQIAQHRKRSINEIFEWLESTSEFIYKLQTNEERERVKIAKQKI